MVRFGDGRRGRGRGGRLDVKGTRIASISGLRGWVGDGIDPVTAAEFAAAYASGREPGPIVVGHDGRVSAPVFEAAVTAAIAGTGRDALIAGAAATPTVGFLVRELGAAGGVQISASHNPPEYNGLKFFQPGGMVLGAADGRAVLDRWKRKEFAWAPFDGLGRMIQEADASTRKFAEEVLKPGQAVRLRQIQYHALGPSAFLNPELAEPLKLTPEQREAAREIVGESVDPARWFVPGDREATLARRRELREIGVKRIKDHLTPEQRERCEGLFGPPFELKMRLRQRPGPQA